jgi:hypothetical protein
MDGDIPAGHVARIALELEAQFPKRLISCQQIGDQCQ